MSPVSTRAFVQARMSSTRFPGKVLAPFKGHPVVWHVLMRIAQVLPKEQIVLATSSNPSDDPLAAYVLQLGFPVFRGPLDNVVERFQLCMRQYPCRWFFRVCADSPLFDWKQMERMMVYQDQTGIHLVTNNFPRTVPRGHGLEMIDSATFLKLDVGQLSAREREHATQYLYAHPEVFRIVNVESEDLSLASQNLCVDTPGDILRLEELFQQTEMVYG